MVSSDSTIPLIEEIGRDPGNRSCYMRVRPAGAVRLGTGRYRRFHLDDQRRAEGVLASPPLRASKLDLASILRDLAGSRFSQHVSMGIELTEYE